MCPVRHANEWHPTKTLNTAVHTCAVVPLANDRSLAAAAGRLHTYNTTKKNNRNNKKKTSSGESGVYPVFFEILRIGKGHHWEATRVVVVLVADRSGGGEPKNPVVKTTLCVRQSSVEDRREYAEKWERDCQQPPAQGRQDCRSGDERFAVLKIR